MKEADTGADMNLLLSAQFLAPGNGGICTAARMTAMALSSRLSVTALACQDNANHLIGSIPVRAFRNNRFSFVADNFFETLRATRVLYDFAGTARAHQDFPTLRRPYAVWVHGWEVWHEPPAKYLRALAGASLLLCNSQYTVDRAGRAMPSGIDVKVCPLGTPQNDAPAALDPNGPPTVLLVGRVDEMYAKGHDLLIDVWPQVVRAVPDARLVFVGGGNAIDKLRNQVAASSARQSIDVAGFVPDEFLGDYWRRATVFAMLGYAEGFGLVYVDAMRHGLPVIASTDDGGQEVNVDGVTGFNIARSDKKKLAEVLVTVLRDRDYARTLGSAGFARWQTKYAFGAFSKRLLAATSAFLST